MRTISFAGMVFGLLSLVPVGPGLVAGGGQPADASFPETVRCCDGCGAGCSGCTHAGSMHTKVNIKLRTNQNVAPFQIASLFTSGRTHKSNGSGGSSMTYHDEDGGFLEYDAASEADANRLLALHHGWTIVSGIKTKAMEYFACSCPGFPGGNCSGVYWRYLRRDYDLTSSVASETHTHSTNSEVGGSLDSEGKSSQESKQGEDEEAEFSSDWTWEFKSVDWKDMACHCCKPPPPPPVDTQGPDFPGGGTTSGGSTVAPPPPVPPPDPVKTGQNPPGQHRFKEPVRVGVADDVSLFSTAVSVVPQKKFSVPAAIRAKDGTLVTVDEVWVQPEGEEPKLLSHVGDTFAGTTPPKPAKLFTVIGGTAVGIIGLIPHGGSGGIGDPVVPPPTNADPMATPPASPSVTAPPDFPAKAPVVELTPRTPTEGVTPTAGTPPTSATPPVAENPPPASTPDGTTGETGPVPDSTPPEPTSGSSVSEPPSGAPSKTVEPDVRMAEGEPTLIATEGVFNPDAVPAMTAELAFPDAKIRRSGDVIFSTDDTALIRTMGNADQTGEMTVTVRDPAGNALVGSANAWTAKLALSQEVLKEGQALAIQIVPAGLAETRLVKYRLELSADAEPITPGAEGQTYAGETNIAALRALTFRVRYPTPGGKPMKLFLEPFPLPTEPATPSRGEK